MYVKALDRYEKAVGPDHLGSRVLRDTLRALDDAMGNNALIEVRKSENIIQEETSSLDARERPSKSKRRWLLRKIGLR